MNKISGREDGQEKEFKAEKKSDPKASKVSAATGKGSSSIAGKASSAQMPRGTHQNIPSSAAIASVSNQQLRKKIVDKFTGEHIREEYKPSDEKENLVKQQWNIKDGNFQENIQGGKTFTSSKAQKEYFQERINDLNELRTSHNADHHMQRQTLAYLILNSKLSDKEKDDFISQIKVKNTDWSNE